MQSIRTSNTHLHRYEIMSLTRSAPLPHNIDRVLVPKSQFLVFVARLQNEWILWNMSTRESLDLISQMQSLFWPFAMRTLRKHAYSNILKILRPKHENFQIKKIWYFSYFSSKHRLWIVRIASTNRKRKYNVYPCKSQFYYIKVGFKGVQNYIGMFLWWYSISADTWRLYNVAVTSMLMGRCIKVFGVRQKPLYNVPLTWTLFKFQN